MQYHPTGLPFTGILITEAARAEGGYLINKDGYRYLQDYALGDAAAAPGAANDGARPARSLVAGVRERARQRTHDRHAVRSGCASGSATSRREEDQRQDSVRARAVHEVPEPRSRQGSDSCPAGRALHDGRRPYRHQRRDAAGRPLRRRRGGLREHQRRQSPRLELPAGTARLRRARRASSRQGRLARTRRSVPAFSRKPTTSVGASSTTCWTRRPRAHRQSSRRDAKVHGGQRRHLPLRRSRWRGRRPACAACNGARRRSPSRTRARRSIPSE